MAKAVVLYPWARSSPAVSFSDPSFEWPGMKQIRVEKVAWAGNHWNEDGAPEYYVNQSSKTLEVVLSTPQAVRVTW